MHEFFLDLPRDEGFSTVAEYVLGGIAARHEMTIDVLDDLQLALSSVLEHGDEDGDVRVEVRILDGAVEASVGPVGDGTAAELEQDDATQRLGLRRLLETTVDDVRVSVRDGVSWVELRKDYVLAGADG
jgi:anti-sigma regulatory factor (Ser/Thr protein kinase)